MPRDVHQQLTANNQYLKEQTVCEVLHRVSMSLALYFLEFLYDRSTQSRKSSFEMSVTGIYIHPPLSQDFVETICIAFKANTFWYSTSFAFLKSNIFIVILFINGTLIN